MAHAEAFLSFHLRPKQPSGSRQSLLVQKSRTCKIFECQFSFSEPRQTCDQFSHPKKWSLTSNALVFACSIMWHFAFPPHLAPTLALIFPLSANDPMPSWHLWDSSPHEPKPLSLLGTHPHRCPLEGSSSAKNATQPLSIWRTLFCFGRNA